mgnify:CR=1 FL=1
MVIGIVKGAYADMQKELVLPVIKEMSTISVGGNPLKPYELVLKDFKSKEARSLRTKLKQVESDDFRYISFDLTLIHISEPTRPLYISYAVFCLKKQH